ncbi:uncharacterized protein LOC111865577 isoform X2 [Cryptotermes secundus]|uniref:uncharacterized protein LOC111865577 isoform X2 n=1 Tax=Cryptotermes secundus TaxID=105785 RepID=UPI001454CEEA|nr:uncharacterized protein LOC111865577 isoform X2 [Cryptotermes secundus]
MNPRIEWYFIFMVVAQWHGATTYRPLLLRDSNSQHKCCGGDHYAGPKKFHQQNDSHRRLGHDPLFTKHRHEYNIPSRNSYQHHDYDYYRPYRLKYSDYKSPPSKYSYHKEYYRRQYSNTPLTETKYMQRRTGVVFPDTHNNLNNGRGHKPYVPDPYFRDHRYNENNDFSDFRNKNGHQGYHELSDDKYRKKYRPGLLGVSVGRLGAVVVTGPDGYKHVIHNLPPWTDLKTEREHYRVSFPGNVDSRGGLEYPGSHRFSTGIHGNVGGHDYQNHHHQTYKEMPTYSGSSKSAHGNKNDSHFVDVYKYSLKSHNENRNQEQGPPRDTSGTVHQTDDREEQDYTVPLKPDKFHPSPPFHRYSEPDPLYHPNRSSLETYLLNERTQFPTTTPTTTPKPHKPIQVPASKKPIEYPDSINAQLPPPDNYTETNVPYVAVTAVTEETLGQHETATTQASDATHMKPLIHTLPTNPTIHRLTESEAPLSTVRENNASSPTSSVPEISTHLSPVKVSGLLTQIARMENGMKTEYLLPTIITEKSDIHPHQTTEPQIYYTTEPSHNTINHNTATYPSPQELNNSYIKETTGTENKNYTVYRSVMAPLQSSSNPNMSTLVSNIDKVTETNTMKSQAASAAIEDAYNLTKTEGSSDPTQALISESEDIHPTVEIYETERVTEKDMTDVIPTVESTVTKPALSMSIQLQTLKDKKYLNNPHTAEEMKKNIK